MKRRALLRGLGLAAGGLLAAPTLLRAQASAGRVVVVGGGVGGATAAKYLKLFNPALHVTLVERHPFYVRPYGSSEVLNGHTTMQALQVSYDALASRWRQLAVSFATSWVRRLRASPSRRHSSWAERRVIMVIRAVSTVCRMSSTQARAPARSPSICRVRAAAGKGPVRPARWRSSSSRVKARALAVSPAA